VTLLNSNDELYSYLTGLAEKLSTRGNDALASLLLAATRTASGIPVTEFLGESRIALRGVTKQETVLTDVERQELLSVLRQLDETFNR
jgi:hypothetical protein